MHTTAIKSRLAILMAAFALLTNLTIVAPMTCDLPIVGGNVAYAGGDDDDLDDLEIQR